MRILTVVFIVLTSATSAYPLRYALVAGQNDGGANVTGLHYAESDARQCARLLSSHASFREELITLTLHPDSAALLKTIDSIAAAIAQANNPEDALFLLYYSGHADADGLLLGPTHLGFTTLKKKLDAIAASMRIAVFDACQSGAVVTLKGGRRAEPFYLASQQKSIGEVWIASSSANEQAQESETLKSSLFSFHFFNGLRGSADISADKKVTLNEAYQYAYQKTIETSALTSGIIQHPMYRFNISGEGDIILTDLTKKEGGIIIDKLCYGSFLILSRDYTDVYADFRKDGQKELFIALASGDYTIINASGGTNINLFQFSLEGTKTIRCTPDMFHKSFLQESRIKGEGVGVLPSSAAAHSRQIISIMTAVAIFLAGMTIMLSLWK